MDRADHLNFAHICQKVDESSSYAVQEGKAEEDVFGEQTAREILECILRESEQYKVNFVRKRQVQIDEKATTTCPSNGLSLVEDGKDVFLFVVYDEEEASILKCDYPSACIAKEFLGACADTEAQMFVIGRQNALAYFNFTVEELKTSAPNRTTRFKFGNRPQFGLCRVEIRMPIDDSQFLCPYVKIVDVDILRLLGLHFIDDYKMNVDTANDMHECRSLHWSFSLTRRLG